MVILINHVPSDFLHHNPPAGDRHFPPSVGKLHPQEKTLLILSSVYLSLMPWAFGCMYVNTQIVSLCMAFLTLMVALWPRSPGKGQDAYRQPMWPRLLKCPIFWLGLLLLAYIFVQALNPAWLQLRLTYLSASGRPRLMTWLQPLPFVEWLPSSIKVPLTDNDMSPWRVLMIYGAVWILACALWIGITRRKSIRILFTVLIVNGTLWTLIGIFQKFTGADEVLWFLARPKYAVYFFSTMIYKNHAGAYINLILTLCSTLMVYHMLGFRPMRGKANPTPLFALFIVPLLLGLYLTQSRGAAVVFLVYASVLLLFLLGLSVRRALEHGFSRMIIVSGILCLGMAAVLLSGAKLLNVERYYTRYRELWENPDEISSWVLRKNANQVTWEIAEDNIVTGWGAGSFRYLFGKYAHDDSQLTGTPGKRHVRWEYAHNDYLQFLAEYGIIGCCIAAINILFWVAYLLYHRFFRSPGLVLLTLGLLGLMAHCVVDFQTHNPSILMLACVMATLGCLWARFNHLEYKARISGRNRPPFFKNRINPASEAQVSERP